MAAVLTLLVGALPVWSAAGQGQDEFLLGPGRAGRIELGTSVDEVYQLFGRDNVSLVAEFREGMFSPALKIKLPGTATVPAISTDIREWPCGEFSVWGIDVRDNRFRTKDGFGVGSTAGDLRRAHPFRITEEEGAHAAVVDDLKMTFSLTRQGPVDQQRITSAWIWPDPDAVRKKRCPGRDGDEIAGPVATAQASSRISRVLEGAYRQVGITTIYDSSYRRLSFPGGDVPIERGVCSDVIVRAYRHAGLDLQLLVNQDMSGSFQSYPQAWGLSKPDANIDHRRVPNLAAFFRRKGQSLPVSTRASDYHAGDIVTWRLASGVPHIGLVADRLAGGRPLVIHNIGGGAQVEDVLFSYAITGHYRYDP